MGNLEATVGFVPGRGPKNCCAVHDSMCYIRRHENRVEFLCLNPTYQRLDDLRIRQVLHGTQNLKCPIPPHIVRSLLDRTIFGDLHALRLALRSGPAYKYRTASLPRFCHGSGGLEAPPLPPDGWLFFDSPACM